MRIEHPKFPGIQLQGWMPFLSTEDVEAAICLAGRGVTVFEILTALEKYYRCPFDVEVHEEVLDIISMRLLSLTMRSYIRLKARGPVVGKDKWETTYRFAWMT